VTADDRDWADDYRDCAEALRDLQFHLDAELSPDEAARLVAHIEACPPCAVEEDDFRRLKEAIRRHGSAVDQTVVARLRARCDDLLADPTAD
jgi:anti-sigma factor (TIGR02949 family)